MTCWSVGTKLESQGLLKDFPGMDQKSRVEWQAVTMPLEGGMSERERRFLAAGDRTRFLATPPSGSRASR